MKILRIGGSCVRRKTTPYRPEVDPGVCQAIACCLDMFQFEGPLLPNLQEIWCQNGDRDGLWNIYPFLSSNLQSFGMDVEQPPGPDIATMTILSALGVKSPHLKHFSIQGGWFQIDELKLCVSISLCGLLHLHTFHCPEIALTWEAVDHLASLPNLYEADIHVQGQINITSSHHSPFPALRTLALNGSSITPEIEFIKHFIVSALLESFTICIEDPPSSAELGQMFSNLLAHSSSECLTSIYMDHPSHISFGDGASPNLKPHDFDSLLKFTNLESILIQTECTAQYIDDATLEAMAQSWPKLRDLAFNAPWSSGNRWPSQCTLRGILHLVKHCPNLASLRIPFNASAEISWNGRPGGGVVCEQMGDLDVGYSPITDPRAVASFLSDVFPKLQSITTWDHFDADDPAEVELQHLWQETNRLFESFVAIRNEERAWAANVGRVGVNINCS